MLDNPCAICYNIHKAVKQADTQENKMADKHNNETINLYELQSVWLPVKYPGKRPSEITDAMIAEFVTDRKKPNWYQELT